MNDLNYPIKYTYMPIFEHQELKAYVAVKCYVIDDSFEIESNGKTIITKKVVPFYSERYKKQEPYFINEFCYNFKFTNIVFDELEEAIRYTRVLNNSKILNPDYNLLEKYYKLENDMLNDKEIYTNIIDFNEYKKRRIRRYE